jgi:hypothetical protein
MTPSAKPPTGSESLGLAVVSAGGSNRPILLIRGCRVMLDADLAALYRVETRALVQAVKRNRQRFPDDFMFQTTPVEVAALRSQSVISNSRGGRRYRPYAFTEQGVAMLSSVLRSPRAEAVAAVAGLAGAGVRADGVDAVGVIRAQRRSGRALVHVLAAARAVGLVAGRAAAAVGVVADEGGGAGARVAARRVGAGRRGLAGVRPVRALVDVDAAARAVGAVAEGVASLSEWP